MTARLQSSRPVRLHCVVITHTHKPIARTLMGLGCQTHPPASVTVSCDTDDERIAREVARASDRTGLTISLVMRPRCEESRRSQTRNNAVRALLDRRTDPSDLLVFYDGDSIPDPGANAAHARMLARRDVSLGWLLRLTETQSAALTDEDALQGTVSRVLSDEQHKDIRRADVQTRKRILLRKLGMTKPHKPTILSGNFGVTLGRFCAINGFDESYTGWGGEDDDLARRLYLDGARPGSCIRSALVYHQYHPTEAPKNWADAPNSHRLATAVPARAELGLATPTEQPTPRVQVFGRTDKLATA
jgi:hypothetical protein